MPDLFVGHHRLKPGADLFFLLGPCVIESRELVNEVAAELARIATKLGISVVFKASFDKANRTSVSSFRGPGMVKGLEILASVRERTGLPLVSDIHAPDQAPVAGEVLDLIQIPAFLCRQTDLLVAAGLTGKPVNVKKGQFMAPEDMAHAVEKIKSTGNDRILLTERGSSFGYHDLVVDMRSIVRMKRLGCPVVFDATHSVQLPGGQGSCSGGDREFIPALARAAVAAGADGVFMEVHPDPASALCDGPNSLPLKDVEPLLKELINIRRCLTGGGTTEERAASPATADVPGPIAWEERLKRIRLIIFDVDGILTDGRITFGSGNLEIKSFDVRDGHGIKIAKRCGLEVALVTGRISEIVPRRAEDLGIELVFQKVWDKKPILDQLLEQLQLLPEEVAVLGDDVVDIPLLRRVGLGCTVPEAPDEVRAEADYVTKRAGGRGAAREVVELILKAQGKWDAVMARYYA